MWYFRSESSGGKNRVLEPSTNTGAPRKVGLWAAVIGLGVLVVVLLVLLFRGDGRRKSVQAVTQPPAPELPVEPPAQPDPSPAEPVATTQPLPSPVAVADVRPTAGDITQLLVLSRRVETTDPERARQLLRQILELDPQNEVALERLAKKLLLDEKPSDARELLDRCLAAHPGSAECAAVNSQLPDPQGNEAAVKSANDCVTKTPDDTSCIFTLTDSALTHSQKDAASLYALRMHQLAPESPLTKLALGRLNASNGKFREARTQFEAACKHGNEQGCFRANLLRLEGW